MTPSTLHTTLSLLLLHCLAATPALAAGDPVKGKATYALRCAACHSIDYNGAGPAHRALLGSKAGGVAGFAYSPALKSSTVIWSDKTLEKWLSNPEKFIPGQRMGVAVADPVERRDIIAYLHTENRQ